MNFLSVIPPVIVIILALWSKNVLVSLFVGIVLGSLILNGAGFIPPIVDKYFIQGIGSNGSILMCMMLLGIMLNFIKQGGGFKAFAEWSSKRIKTAKQTAVSIFFLSLLLGVAGSLGQISISRFMRPAIYKTKLPKEKSAFIVASVCSNTGTLLPFGLMLIFISGLISSLEMDGFSVYLSSWPYFFFAFISIIIACLVAFGIFPDIGMMKKIEKDIKESEAEGGFSDDVEMTDVLGGPDVKADIWAFILPITLLLIGLATVSLIVGKPTITGGILIGTVTAAVYDLLKGSVSFGKLTGCIIRGFQDMAGIYLILVFAFAFGVVVTDLGFASYMVSLVSSFLSTDLVPLVTFLLCCIISYATGSLSASAVIVVPLSLPLALTVGASLPLTTAAMLSGSLFGDQSSPISDNVILPATSAGVDPVDLSKIMAPYRLITFIICAVLYGVLGFIV
ncbi:Na+/H+ antiporter NhaC family protein [Lachnospiraceae bacterium 62-35]